MAARVLDALHHDLAVGSRVRLAPLDVLAVLPELPSARREVREVGVRKALRQLLDGALRLADVGLRDRLADVAAAGVEQKPEEIVVLPAAHLDEVVASSECSELVDGFGDERFGGRVRPLPSLHPCPARLEGLAFLMEADRDLPFDGMTQFLQVLGVQPVRGQ